MSSSFELDWNCSHKLQMVGSVLFYYINTIYVLLAGSTRGHLMKQILCSDWLPKMGLCWDCLLCSRNLGVIFWPYNKPFIDQACLVKVAAGY